MITFKISFKRLETTGPIFLVPTFNSSISLTGAPITPFNEPNAWIKASAIFTDTPGHCAKQQIPNCFESPAFAFAVGLS